MSIQEFPNYLFEIANISGSMDLGSMNIQGIYQQNNLIGSGFIGQQGFFADSFFDVFTEL